MCTKLFSIDFIDPNPLLLLIAIFFALACSFALATSRDYIEDIEERIKLKKINTIKEILKEGNANKKLIIKRKELIDEILLESIEKVVLKKVEIANDFIVDIYFKGNVCKSYYLRDNFKKIMKKSFKKQLLNQLIRNIKIVENEYEYELCHLIIEGEGSIYYEEVIFEEFLPEIFKIKSK